MGCWSGPKRSPAVARYTYLEYARFADDLVILVDAYPQHDWLLKAGRQTTPGGIGDAPGRHQ